MTFNTILTVDSGTSRLKAALYSYEGKLLAIASRAMTVIHPFDGASEMDMCTVWDGMVECCLELSRAHPEDWKHLTGVAITGQGDGLWPVDNNGKPVRNAILWNDSRCKRLQLSNEAEITAFGIAHSISPLFVAAKPLLLKWMLENEPDRFKQVQYALYCKDWLVYNLTGRMVTERTDASTSMVNILEDQYEFGLLELLELPSKTSGFFPEIVDSLQIVGKTTQVSQDICSIPAGIPVMAGAIDVVATSFGAGARLPGDAVTTLGTTFCNQVVLTADQVSHEDVAGSTLCFMYPKRFVRVMASSNGCSAIDWARNIFMQGKDFNNIESEVSQISAGSEGIFFLPYMNGERAPFRISCAASQFSGLSPQHTPDHLMRAVYEGLVYSLKDCYSHLPTGETPIVLAGGATASKVLCQMCADILNRPMLRVPEQEFGLHGMAMSLLEAIGIGFPQLSLEERGEVFNPDEKTNAIYQEGFEIYRQLRESMVPFWKSRDAFLSNIHSR
jgi:sugar (pentulose or hexulose) kinase